MTSSDDQAQKPECECRYPNSCEICWSPMCGGCMALAKHRDALSARVAELEKQIRFDVDSNSATGWMVKYTRALDENENLKQERNNYRAMEAILADQNQMRSLREELDVAKLENRALSKMSLTRAEELEAANETIKALRHEMRMQGGAVEREKKAQALLEEMAGCLSDATSIGISTRDAEALLAKCERWRAGK